MFSVYFAKSLKNNKIYTGFTSKKPEVRLQEHNNGANKWSRENKPLKLIYYETYHCENDARHREMFYKSGIGKRIKKIIADEFDK